MKKVEFDELFYELRKCHHKAIDEKENQEVVTAHHLLSHCDIYLKEEKPTSTPISSTNYSSTFKPHKKIKWPLVVGFVIAVLLETLLTLVIKYINTDLEGYTLILTFILNLSFLLGWLGHIFYNKFK